MTTTVADIIVSPARVWLAPAGEPLPDETTIGLGAPWGGNWVDLGPTEDAVTLGYSDSEYEVRVDQFTGPLARYKVDEDYMLEASLAQLTPAQLAKMLAGSNTETPAGAAQRAFDEIKAGGEFTLTEYVVGCEGRKRTSSGAEYPVRCFLPKATVRLNGSLKFTKKAMTGIPFQAKALADSSAAEGEQLFKMHRITASATTES